MYKLMQPFCITKNIFLEECGNKRVIMGFVLGLALFGYWLNFFFRYALDTGEPVNILESFIVIEHHYKNMLFLVLGWLLIVSDAPFIKGNIYFLMYRSSRRKWNIGMLFYIMVQAFFYVAFIAALSVTASSFLGFSGDMWSSPVYDLAMDVGNDIGVEYNITFPWENMMRCMSVPQAFAVTFLFMWLYLLFLGVLLYVCNLLLKGIFGILIVFGIQLSGYLLQQDGFGDISLFAKSMPAYSIDRTGMHWETALLFLGMILSLALVSLWLVRHVDFKDAEEEK